tara:strand:+ start:9977 stop:10282 length:306 start_codon:yes stop_codon:yes gene_type:complete
MKLELNVDAKEGRTKTAYDNALESISNNLQNGEVYTELYIDKHIAAEVRDRLNAEFKKQGKENNFTWMVVRRSPNEFTGRMQSFTGETQGNTKYYKLKYYE